MVSRINRFVMQNGLMQNDSEYNGRTVLGFDTGLDSQAFAQSKMAQFISQCGILVFPDGRTEQWKAVGVVEKARTINGTPTMVMWGPDFPGESLDTLVRDQGRKEEAIDAVKYYLKARIIVGNEQPIYGGACGVMVASGNGTENYPRGTILFMPERLTKRCIEAGGDDEILAASQWVHPDFRNDDLTVFSAAAMFYTILTGQIPFQQKDGDTLRQDIREGVFIPLRLAAPGLDKNIDAVITESLEPDKKKENGKRRPSPDQFLQAVGLPGSSKSVSWFRVLQTEEKQKIENELGQYRKNSEFTVKTRRFVIRNTTIIVVCLAVILCAVLIVRGAIQRQAELPNTRGLTPAEVASLYYGSFEKLDQETMDACTSGKKAKIDVNMIVNLYVIQKTREAYETTQTSMTAQDWLDNGSPQTNATVFGVTDLKVSANGGNEASGVVHLKADYKLWMPPSFAGDDTDLPSDEAIMSGDYVNPPPKAYHYSDDLELTWMKDSWRITDITRTVLQ